MKLKGSQAIIKVLVEQGVDTVFGYPGGQVIPLYDALYDVKKGAHCAGARRHPRSGWLC